MIEHLLNVVQNADSLTATDFADKCNFKYTAIFMCLLATFTTLKSYVGDPIDCWTPEYFTSQWIQYGDTYCWMRNTYHIPDGTTIIEARDELHVDTEIKYYQWVPIILAVVASTFYVPNLFWHSTMRHTLDINNIVDAITDKSCCIDKIAREKRFELLAEHMGDYFSHRKANHYGYWADLRQKFASSNMFCLIWGYRYGNYIGVSYLLVKIMYICICIGNIVMLDFFFGPNYYLYGYQLWRTMDQHKDWVSVTDPRFPRITFCDFTIQNLGQPKTHTVQCVLTINLFNEKIFSAVWFWLIANTMITVFSLCSWTYFLTIRSRRLAYISHHIKFNMKRKELAELKALGTASKSFPNKPTFDDFVDNYLKPDGVFLFRMISRNSNCTVTADLIRAVWEEYKDYKASHEEYPNNEKEDLGVIEEKMSKISQPPSLACLRENEKKKLYPMLSNGIPPVYPYTTSAPTNDFGKYTSALPRKPGSSHSGRSSADERRTSRHGSKQGARTESVVSSLARSHRDDKHGRPQRRSNSLVKEAPVVTNRSVMLDRFLDTVCQPEKSTSAV